jgi:hypothetical protein
LHTQNNSVKQKSYKRFTPFLKRSFKTNYSQTNKKDEKGTENYRLVAFKDMSNEDVLSLNLLRKQEKQLQLMVLNTQL